MDVVMDGVKMGVLVYMCVTGDADLLSFGRHLLWI